MNENIEKYGTDTEWHVGEYKEAEVIFEEYKDRKMETIHDVNRVISDLLIDHGPDGHTDGSQIIALIVWRLLKK